MALIATRPDPDEVASDFGTGRPLSKDQHMLAHMPRIFLAVTSAGIAVLITALILMVLRL
jgi:hypothetical protein